MQHFDGNYAIHQAVSGFVDSAHGSTTDYGQNFVFVIEGRTDKIVGIVKIAKSGAIVWAGCQICLKLFMATQTELSGGWLANLRTQT
jgi:hypothetical protein